MHGLHERYGRVAAQHGRPDAGEGPPLRAATGHLLLLFGLHQPLAEARRVTCDLLLELIEARLDEGLGYLEGDGPRLARRAIAAERAYGSAAAYRDALLERMRGVPPP